MSRYWRIYRTFARSSLQRELEFRANFFAKLAQNAVWTFFFLVVLLVIFSRTDSVAGWTRGQAMVLAGTIFLLDASFRTFFWSVIEIPENVRKGTLDFVVTKPVDTQFWISTRKFDFGHLGALVAGSGVIAFGVFDAGLAPTGWDVAAYVSLTLCAMAIFYAINFAMMTLGIWWVRVDNLWVLSDTMMGVSRFPIDIYGIWVQRIFMYVLPLAFLAHYPAAQLRSGADPRILLLGLAWVAISLAACRIFWQTAMKSYGSASS